MIEFNKMCIRDRSIPVRITTTITVKVLMKPPTPSVSYTHLDVYKRQTLV